MPSEPTKLRSDYADVPAVARVLTGYVIGLARDVAFLSQPLTEDRRAAVRRVAHQLRGSGGAYGFGEVTLAAEALEAALDGGAGAEHVAPLAANLIGVIRRIEGYDPSNEASHGPRKAA